MQVLELVGLRVALGADLVEVLADGVEAALDALVALLQRVGDVLVEREFLLGDEELVADFAQV